MVNPHFQTVVVVVTASMLMSCASGPDEEYGLQEEESVSEDSEISEVTESPEFSEVKGDLDELVSDTIALIEDEVYDSLFYEFMLNRFEALIADYSAISGGKEIWRMDSIAPDSIRTRIVTLEEILIQLNEVGSFLAGSGGQMSLNQIIRLSDLQSLLAQEQQLAIIH
jgi:hypothetical protein